MVASTPGSPPKVGSQLGEHEVPSASQSGSTRAVQFHPHSGTLVLAASPALQRATAVTCTLSASSGTSTSSRYWPASSVTDVPPALLVTTAPSAGEPSGARTIPSSLTVAAASWPCGPGASSSSGSCADAPLAPTIAHTAAERRHLFQRATSTSITTSRIGLRDHMQAGRGPGRRTADIPASSSPPGRHRPQTRRERVLRSRQRRRSLGATVTGNAHADWFPEASVAVHVTSVVPRGKKLPEGGTHTMLGAGSRQSLAAIEKVTTSPAGLPSSSFTRRDGGQASAGGSSSSGRPH